MKVALGIHVGHDRGVCVVKDGTVAVCISQERLDRIKYSKSFQIPFQAIDAALRYCKISFADISCIGLSYDGIDGTSIQELYRGDILAYYGVQYRHIPFYIVNHHDAHAYATFCSSGLKDSIIFIADGAGDYMGKEQEAETLYLANEFEIIRVEQRTQAPPVRRIGDDVNYIYPRMPHFIRNAEISIGRKYEQVTHLLGFGWGEAGKTMGLASYGKSLVNFDKEYYCDLSFSLKYGDILSQLYFNQVLSGLTFRDYINKERENIASTVQCFVETSITSLIKNEIEKYQCKNICLGGGLFLNCLTNQRVIEECFPDNFFVLPASGDDGQALGCAYYAYKQSHNTLKFRINLPYLGLSYDESEIVHAIKSKNLKYTKYEDSILVTKMAQMIADNKIIALHRGRTEFGPRALCHRSILANPTNENMKDILNKRVKHREPFRPFAPTVIKEEQFKYFNLKTDSDYMLLATTVKTEYRKALSSITHVDNTARVQSVSKKSDPFLHKFLTTLKTHIGFPIVLNTSFNIAGEPIIESPLDALNTFLSTDIDALVIENFLIEK